MPFPFVDRPTPPGQPGAEPIAEADVNGKKIPISLLREIYGWGEQNNHVMRISQEPGHERQLGEQMLATMQAVRQKDRLAAARGYKSMTGHFFEVFRVYKPLDLNPLGVPPRDGAPEAIRTAAFLLKNHDGVQTLIRVDPAWLQDQATECEFLFMMSSTLLEGHQHVSAVGGAVSKGVIGDVRTVAKLMKPQVETSFQLSQVAEPLYVYLKEPYEKAAQSRRGNERRDEVAEKKAEERIGAVARTEARAEVEAKYNDSLAALVGDKKK